jgi:hypothetical protein
MGSPPVDFVQPTFRSAAAGNSEAAGRVTDRRNMFFYGDSHTIALQQSLDGWRQISGVPQARYQNGTRLDQWAPGGDLWSRVQADLRPGREMIFSLGTNDHGRSPDAIKDDVRRLVTAVRQGGGLPTFVLPAATRSPNQQVNDEVSAARLAMRQQLSGMGVRFVDMSTLPLEIQRNDSPRGLHPTYNSYNIVTRELRRIVSPGDNWPPRGR